MYKKAVNPVGMMFHVSFKYFIISLLHYWVVSNLAGYEKSLEVGNAGQ